MKQCLGPCVTELTDRTKYMEMVDDVVLFLGGKTKELQTRLKERMYGAAESENFEVATYYRDLIRTIERIQSEQRVASSSGEDADVWGLYEEGGDVATQVFILRDGNVVDRREIFWEKVAAYDRNNFLAEVIQRYYQDNLFIPPELQVPFELEEQELITQWLTAQRGSKVTIRIPQRGNSVDRLELAMRNARLSHESCCCVTTKHIPTSGSHYRNHTHAPFSLAR
jgi:excinuclease ABC subunit C